MARLVLAYLFRRPVQVLAVFGVAVGLLALLVVLSVMNGLIATDREGARGPLSDLLLIPAATEEAPRYEDYRAALEDVDVVKAVSPHLVAYAVLGLRGRSGLLNQASNSDINGVQMVGIDPAAEMATTAFRESLERSDYAPVRDPDHPFSLEGVPDVDPLFARPAVLVSDSLALQTGLAPGERIQLGALPTLLPPPGEELRPHNGEFVVAGTYRSLDYKLDMDRVFVPRVGRNSLHYDLLGREAADFTEVLIELREGVEYDAGKAAVLAGLSRSGLPAPGGARGGALQTWEERRSVYLLAIENERRVTGLVLFFIVIVATFGLFATLSALVREKIRDLGILAALGFSPLRRGALLMSVGAAASLAGTLIGVAGARLIVANMRGIDRFLSSRALGDTVYFALLGLSALCAAAGLALVARARLRRRAFAAPLLLGGLGAAALGVLLLFQQPIWEYCVQNLRIVIFPANLYVIQELPARWIPGQALWLSAAAFAVGCLFTLAPALRAASFPPAQALRYE